MKDIIPKGLTTWPDAVDLNTPFVALHKVTNAHHARINLRKDSKRFQATSC
jgi:hypothetical protein